MDEATQPAKDHFEQTIVIEAPSAAVFECFFDPDAIRVWWQAARSVTTLVPFGVYAVEWPATPFRDELLGPLGGVFHGTVVDVRPAHQFLVAEAYWVPPEGQPLGPMALDIRCQSEAARCRLRVRQDGCEPSPRWRRYYGVIAHGWQISLVALKRYAEGR